MPKAKLAENRDRLGETDWMERMMKTNKRQKDRNQ